MGNFSFSNYLLMRRWNFRCREGEGLGSYSLRSRRRPVEEFLEADEDLLDQLWRSQVGPGFVTGIVILEVEQRR